VHAAARGEQALNRPVFAFASVQADKEDIDAREARQRELGCERRALDDPAPLRVDLDLEHLARQRAPAHELAAQRARDALTAPQGNFALARAAAREHGDAQGLDSLLFRCCDCAHR